ncbi:MULTISPECIES: NfeD family protein [Shewanella]|jgi:membrane protein implicated in regulation of membrane protease activity|uniref:NfeD family protein n=1 Tax=Shewanella holmiensis TaxID=2952222 RepID=A0A9X2WMF1_9GAMM|nr:MULTISPECIES: NfeD family protein [Shewanella]MCT7942043.1 NfeD family protein [Shewanella holmiensis]MDP5147239.1 NfeD family protein [Shewanella sp. ULN5]
MSVSDPISIWLIVGIVLMLSEIIIPGGIVILLGTSCLLVAAALALGIVEGISQSLTLWFISSMVLLLSFRHVTQRLVGGDSRVDNTDEELDLYNQHAIVKETIGPGQQTGRISCLGSDWTALGDGSEIKSGTKVRIICRDNIALVVEPLLE